MASVTLRLEVQFEDIWRYFFLPAPQIPAGVSWHTGLWFHYGSEEAIRVVAVFVDAKQNAVVVFEEKYRYDESDIADLIKHGWVEVDKDWFEQDWSTPNPSTCFDSNRTDNTESFHE